MAQKIQVLLLDDLDGGDAEETVQFGLDGASYEIDLSAKNAGELRKVMSKFVDVARRGSSARRSPGRPANGQTPRVDREQNAAIRDWARKRGHSVSDRGRIPAEIIAAYHASR